MNEYLGHSKQTIPATCVRLAFDSGDVLVCLTTREMFGVEVL